MGGPRSLSNFKSGRRKDFQDDSPQLGLAHIRVGVVDHLVGRVVQKNSQNAGGADKVQSFCFGSMFTVLLVDEVDEVNDVRNGWKLDDSRNFSPGTSDPEISGRDKKSNDEKFGQPSPTRANTLDNSQHSKLDRGRRSVGCSG